jgi:hypothetical protein
MKLRIAHRKQKVLHSKSTMRNLAVDKEISEIDSSLKLVGA